MSKWAVWFLYLVYMVLGRVLCVIGYRKNVVLTNYSAGDVISSVNGEKYGSNKTVKDKELNQHILVEKITEKLESERIILLAGHFCILGNDGEVEQLPLHTYSKLQLSSIILLESDPDIIIQNLSRRDGKEYSVKQIETFLCTERNCAMHTAESLSIPFSNKQVVIIAYV